MKSKKLTMNIVIALVAGIIIGSICDIYADTSLVKGVDQYFFNTVGQIFLNLIFMLVVPVVFVSIVLGVVGVGDPKLLGGIGLKTLVFFLCTTAIAITIAIVLALVVKPGAGHSDLMKSTEVASYQKTLDKQSEGAEAPANQTFDQTLINLFPKNPIESMTQGNMLQVITFSIFIGIGMMVLGDKALVVRQFFEQFNEILMYIISMIMRVFAPIGTFCLVAHAFTGAGLGAIKQLGLYFIVVLAALILHFFLIYGGTIKLSLKTAQSNSLKDLFQRLRLVSAVQVLMRHCQFQWNVPRKWGYDQLLRRLYNRLVQLSIWMVRLSCRGLQPSLSHKFQVRN